MSEASYSREVIDTKFEALRHEIRADLAEQIGTVRRELAEQIGGVRREVAELSGQMRVWVVGAGLLTSVLTVVITKVWH